MPRIPWDRRRWPLEVCIFQYYIQGPNVDVYSIQNPLTGLEDSSPILDWVAMENLIARVTYRHHMSAKIRLVQ